MKSIFKYFEVRVSENLSNFIFIISILFLKTVQILALMLTEILGFYRESRWSRVSVKTRESRVSGLETDIPKENPKAAQKTERKHNSSHP